MFYVKIPKERLGVLIGEKGVTKNEIEERSGVKLIIDSNAGDVTIDDTEVEDPVIGLKVRDMVKAIARGFSPQKAFRLFDDEVYFELMDIRDYVGKSAKRIRLMRGRLIGTDGKTRRIIEELTGTNVSIYGNTVGIIGKLMEVDISKRAVEMVLRGSEHSAVYRFLESKRREKKTTDFGF